MKVCSKCKTNEIRGPKQAWCNACYNAYQRARYVPHPRQAGTLCTKCGEKPRLSYSYRCRDCFNEDQRAKQRKYANLSDEAKLKGIARSLAGKYLKRGRIVRGPCEKCGAAKAEMHHEDYGKPLEIRWLCLPCHREEHRNGKASSF